MSEQLEKRIAACAEAVEQGRGLQHALGITNKYIEQVQDKAHELYRAERFDDAETLCRGLIALAPERFYPHLLLSDVLRRTGKFTDSMDEIRAAAALAPDNELVTLKHAQALMAAGKYEQALRKFREIGPDTEFSGRARLLESRCLPVGAVS